MEDFRGDFESIQHFLVPVMINIAPMEATIMQAVSQSLKGIHLSFFSLFYFN